MEYHELMESNNKAEDLIVFLKIWDIKLLNMDHLFREYCLVLAILALRGLKFNT